MSKKVIDISKHNRIIDWTCVVNDVDGIIIRLGYGEDIESQDDTILSEAYEACINSDIPFGYYFYTYALSIDDCESEINHINRLLEEYPLTKKSLGVFIDFEDADSYKSQRGFDIWNDIDNSNEILHALKDGVNTDLLGIYASCSLMKRLDYNYFDLVWIAHYSDICDTFDDSYTAHQYTSDGNILGIENNVDISEWFNESAWDLDNYEDYPNFDDIFDLYNTVKKVLNGEFGNGEERREKLGEHYEEVQNVINLYYPYLASTKDLISAEKAIDKSVFYELLYTILEI